MDKMGLLAAAYAKLMEVTRLLATADEEFLAGEAEALAEQVDLQTAE